MPSSSSQRKPISSPRLASLQVKVPAYEQPLLTIVDNLCARTSHYISERPAAAVPVVAQPVVDSECSACSTAPVQAPDAAPPVRNYDTLDSLPMSDFPKNYNELHSVLDLILPTHRNVLVREHAIDSMHADDTDVSSWGAPYAMPAMCTFGLSSSQLYLRVHPKGLLEQAVLANRALQESAKSTFASQLQKKVFNDVVATVLVYRQYESSNTGYVIEAVSLPIRSDIHNPHWLRSEAFYSNDAVVPDAALTTASVPSVSSLLVPRDQSVVTLPQSFCSPDKPHNLLNSVVALLLAIQLVDDSKPKIENGESEVEHKLRDCYDKASKPFECATGIYQILRESYGEKIGALARAEFLSRRKAPSYRICDDQEEQLADAVHTRAVERACNDACDRSQQIWRQLGLADMIVRHAASRCAGGVLHNTRIKILDDATLAIATAICVREACDKSKLSVVTDAQREVIDAVRRDWRMFVKPHRDTASGEPIYATSLAIEEHRNGHDLSAVGRDVIDFIYGYNFGGGKHSKVLSIDLVRPQTHRFANVKRVCAFESQPFAYRREILAIIKRSFWELVCAGEKALSASMSRMSSSATARARCLPRCLPKAKRRSSSRTSWRTAPMCCTRVNTLNF